MDALQTIIERRSARSFLDKPIPIELVDRLIDAAAHSPSAGGAEPWQLVVVDDRGTLDRIGRSHSSVEMAGTAPLGIAVCGVPERERVSGFWVQDCAALTQNLLLAAHALGLGAVWTGIYPIRNRVLRFRQLLELPADVVPVSFVLVGYPARRLEPKEVSLEGRVHRNRWGQPLPTPVPEESSRARSTASHG
ncbi:MAG: nitroreductase family protein [Proteobacteria bacterium]|nr:nitroreductase family protein [Pseudomonadota bacterium]